MNLNRTLDTVLETDQEVDLISSGGASAVEEPGHFEIRKSSSQITRVHLFPQKKLTTFF